MKDMTIGQRIAARRRELKLTQEQLAQELGVTAQAVSKWEHDLSCPDIAILPKLARILGISTDTLLGAQQEEPIHNAVPVEEDIPGEESDQGPGIYVNSEGDNKFNIRFSTPPVRSNLVTAAWLICMGLLLLGDTLLRQGGYTPRDGGLGFWNGAWISGLIVWGASGMVRRVKCSNVLITAAGVYFALNGLDAISWPLQWNVLLPLLLVALGLCLALEGRRNSRTKRPVGDFHTGGASGLVEDGWLAVSNSFGENEYRVNTPLLRGGSICNSFGEQRVDFSGVEQVDTGCCISVEGNFGEIELRLPRRFRVNYSGSKNFAEVNTVGQPDIEPEGTLNLSLAMNFGELNIHYI